MQSMIYGLIPLAIVCYNVIIEVITEISKCSDVSKIYGNKYQQLDDHKNYYKQVESLTILPTNYLSKSKIEQCPYVTKTL